MDKGTRMGLFWNTRRHIEVGIEKEDSNSLGNLNKLCEQASLPQGKIWYLKIRLSYLSFSRFTMFHVLRAGFKEALVMQL